VIAPEIKRWLVELKIEACHLGRFPKDKIGPYWFDERSKWARKIKWKPFRCSGYNRIVRRINLLETSILRSKEQK
jgi:hypothetical protein